MNATVYQISDHPKRRPLSLDELLVQARRIAAGAAIPPEDEPYRRDLLTRCGVITQQQDEGHG